MASLFLLAVAFITQTNPLLASKDYTDCNWFGDDEPIPMHPLNVCSSHSHEDELDGLTLYSVKRECSEGTVIEYEYNSTDCEGPTFNETIYKKEDGYYFHCDAATSCPFTKMVFWEFEQDPHSNATEDGHHGHHCAFDTSKYHEISVVTNLCIDLVAEYGYSFLIDCTAKEVTYSEFNDTACKVPKNDDDLFVIEEGCDDVFNISAFIQVAECEDAHYRPDDGGDGDGMGTDGMVPLLLTVVIAAVVLLLAVVICAAVLRKRNESQIHSVNVSNEPLNHDFKSIEDAVPVPDASPDSTQLITTQGQEIDEIALDSVPGAI